MKPPHRCERSGVWPTPYGGASVPTITLSLTQGQQTVIDAEDWPRVSAHSWYACRYQNGFYACTKGTYPDGRRQTLGLHRFIMEAGRGDVVDHIDGDPLNNTRANLRFATPGQNRANSRVAYSTRSGYKGAYWKSGNRRNHWEAQVRHAGKCHFLGCFFTAEEAARAYDIAARELFGQFAHLNFPD